MNQLARIFNNNFMFGVPPVKSDFYLFLIIAFSALIIAGVAILVFAKGELRKFLRTLITPFLTAGILGLISLVSRYERLPWLAPRFFLIFVVTAFLIWMIVIVVWLVNYLPKYQKTKFMNEKFNKYLPKKK